MNTDATRPDLMSLASKMNNVDPGELVLTVRHWDWRAEHTTDGPVLTLVVDARDAYNVGRYLALGWPSLAHRLGQPTVVVTGADGVTELDWTNPDPIPPAALGLPDNEWAMP